MEQKKANRKLPVAIAIIILISVSAAYSQGTDIGSGNKSRFYVGFTAMPTQTSIINEGLSVSGKLTSTKKGTISGGLELGMEISKYFGVSSGLTYSSYVGNLSLDTYSVSYDTSDNDTPKETYLRTITGVDISEVQKISYLSIPLNLNFQIPVSDNFGFYLLTGMSFSFPISNGFRSSGKFTYDGYYSAYNLHITNVDYEGLKKDYQNNYEGGLKVKQFNTELFTSAGAQITIQKTVQISLGILYSKLLKDLSDYTKPEKFKLSSKPDQMRSMMEDSNGATASSLGLRISVRFLL